MQLLKPIGQVILDRFVTQAERGSDFIADVFPLELPSIIYKYTELTRPWALFNAKEIVSYHFLREHL